MFAASVPPPNDSFTPSQIRHAYAFDQLTFPATTGTTLADGRGQTIAVVTAFRAPNIRADLSAFDQAFDLPDKLPSGNPILTISGALTGKKRDATWELETALDIEWAHAIAPAARILLVQAKSDSPADLFHAADVARKRPGVTVVSMSWGFDSTPSGQNFPVRFSTPAHHRGPSGKGDGVTFVEAQADNGAANAFPTPNLNVVSVGGTNLSLNGAEYAAETPLPSSVSPATVAYAANTFDLYHAGQWTTAGGTSAAAPQWAALFAIADQGRALAHKHALDGATQTLPALATLPDDDFHTIPGAGPSTGRGSPFANRVITDLVEL